MICSDLNTALTPFLHRYDSDQIAVVCDRNISLPASLLSCPCLALQLSETYKSLQTVSRIWDFLFERHMTRRGLMIAVGGGVLTDIAGFAAATYKRGMDYVNIPTTLLAMVDASSGGKTGFNYHGLKNSIGVFAQPVQTLVSTQWLKTLPSDQFLSGFAEMLKTGLLDTDGLWHRLLNYDLDTMDPVDLAPLIEQCLAVKERIVSADPYETGLRKTLNLGHTFGHALESLSFVHCTSSHCPFLHGYAVLYGLIAELYLSVTRLGCPKEPLQQLTLLMLRYYGRPECKCSDRAQLIDLMRHDKKNDRSEEINCTLLQDVGQPLVNRLITPEEAAEALDYLFSL